MPKPYPTSKPQSGRPPLHLAPLRHLWAHVARRRRKQFVLLLGLMILASFAEVLSIGAVLPFLGVLSSPERVFEHPSARPIVAALGLARPADLIVPCAALFATTAVMAAAIRLLLMWSNTRLSYATGSDLSIEIYRRTLYQPYAVHVSRNSSEIINAVTGKTQTVINGVIYPLVNMVASAVMLGIILCALLAYQPLIALAAFGGFSLIYLVIFKISRARLTNNSRYIADSSTKRVKSLQEGLGGIRDLLLDGTQPTYCTLYREADTRLRRAQAENTFISTSPRFLMEALGMVLIAGLAVVLAHSPGGLQEAIPILGGLALGAQRLLPVLQQLYQGSASLRGTQQSLFDTLELLKQPLPPSLDRGDASILPFTESLQFDGVWFRYKSDGPWVLKGIDLVVRRGSRIGVVGATGSGKSTLLDILMGLLEPTTGRLLVDGVSVVEANCRSWQAHIAHVPQSIYLADTTIEQNIAFGVPAEEVDTARVRHAAEQAQIATTIESWEKKYRTVVGERGVRLSGGQRQRIGIARALYKKADVIVLDEATSALDTETESAVMSAISRLDRQLTIFIIAHRLSTLEGCDAIIDVSGGTMKRQSSAKSVATVAQ